MFASFSSAFEHPTPPGPLYALLSVSRREADLSALSHCSSIISGDSRAAVMTSVAYRVRREVTPHISSNGLRAPTPPKASGGVQVPRGSVVQEVNAESYVPSLSPRHCYTWLATSREQDAKA